MKLVRSRAHPGFFSIPHPEVILNVLAQLLFVNVPDPAVFRPYFVFAIRSAFQHTVCHFASLFLGSGCAQLSLDFTFRALPFFFIH
jgi:hypothetical protein